MKVHLLIIDPQIDFMDLPGSALPVAGANADMDRFAPLLDKINDKLPKQGIEASSGEKSKFCPAKDESQMSEEDAKEALRESIEQFFKHRRGGGKRLSLKDLLDQL